MSENVYDLWEETVSKVANFVAKDFPNVYKEDITQELWVFILATPSLKHPDEVGSTRVLTLVAKQAAFKMRTADLQISVQYAYRPSDVRAILRTAFRPESIQNCYLPDDARSIDEDDRIVISADVAAAIDKLPDSDRKLLLLQYKFGVEPESEKDRRALQRAVVKVADILNSYQPKKEHDGPGSRRVISNREAGELSRDRP